MTRLVLIGGGRMGEALLSGLLDANWAEPGEIAVVELSAERRADLVARFPGVNVLDAPVVADGAVLAVKPGDIPAVAKQLAEVGIGRMLSIAAGVTLATLEEAAGPKVRMVRAMPNTPALVGEGAAAISIGATATEEDAAWAESILDAVGIVVRVPESLINAVTGLSGSGPAYIFLVAEALIEAGVLVGLPRPISAELAVQTLVGSARLLAESGDSAEVLRAAVTSPGGTTAAGLQALERNGVRAAILDAVQASARRAAELGGT